MTKEVPLWEKATLTINEAAAYSNIGIDSIRRLASKPGCTFALSVGRKKLIKRKEFEKFIDRTEEIY